MTQLFDILTASFRTRFFLPRVMTLWLLAFLLAGAGAASAMERGGNKVVLELFTSQGCSSCPPADRLLKSYIDENKVIALSLSVDYWDYLGWRDTFGNKVFSQRQRAYAHTFGRGMVYTPQLVVDGQLEMVGSDKRSIDKAIARRKKARAGLALPELKVWTEGEEGLMVSVGAAEAAKPATVWLALVSRQQKVKIRRGENRGHDLYYHNVVREMTPIGRWSGEALDLKLPRQAMMKRGADSCVVLLQQGEGGPILAAAQMGSW